MMMNDDQMKYLKKRIYATRACVDSLSPIEQLVCNALIAEGELVIVKESPATE